ncbi:MAG: hypothetical protein IJK31_08860 [Ruminococcus sp.]|nr:hypothetical protein [Ruminococcus sp.]HRR75440.1 DUF3592 domain-containing protein [Ruminococcus sp.]
MIFMLFALIAVGIGFFLQKCHTDRIKDAQPYTAEIISLQERTRVRRGMAYTEYRPMVKYNNGSKEIIAEHYNGIRAVNCGYQQGETVTIFADKRLPKSFFFPEENHKISYEAVVAFIAAGLLVIFGIIMIPAGL